MNNEIYATHDKLGNIYRLYPVKDKPGVFKQMQNELGEGEEGTLSYFKQYNNYLSLDDEQEYERYKSIINALYK